MIKFKKIAGRFFLFCLIFTGCLLIPACGEKTENKSQIIVVSEENFNSKVNNKDRDSLKFSPSKIKDVEEENIIDGERYYALVYLKDIKLTYGEVVFSASYQVELDGNIFTGIGGGGKLSGEIRGSLMTICVLKNEGKVKKTDAYIAVPFTASMDGSNNTTDIKITFYGYSEFDDTKGARNKCDISFNKIYKVCYKKHLDAVSSIKYLSEDDFKSGSYDEKLKDVPEKVALGEKIYAVIDYTLSGGTLIEDTDALELVIRAKSDDVAQFQLSVEEFKTPDYTYELNFISAKFKIPGVSESQQLFRFIVSVTPESAGTVTLLCELMGEEISVLGQNEVEGKLEISGEFTAESRLEYRLSPDETFYIVKGLGDETRDVITVPLKHDGLPVKEIADNVFANVSHIKEITISSSVEKIGVGAFRGCTGLKSIIIPSSVNIIGNNAFSNITDVEIYCYANGRPDTWSENWASTETYVTWGYGGLFEYINDGEEYSFDYFGKPGVNVAVPAYYNGKPVTQIAGFNSNTELKNIKIPNTVKTIGSSAFEGCTSLKEIHIPDSVITIGKSAFSDCTALRYVVFGENSNLKHIAKWAFLRCTSLTSLTVPKNVTSIGDGAFSSSEKLVEIINKSSLVLTPGADTYGDIAKFALKVHSGVSEIVKDNGYLFYTHNSKKYLLGYDGDIAVLTLPSSYNRGNYEVYKYAFYKCTKLTKVTVPSGVTRIGSCAFSGCSALIDVTVSGDVEQISDSAFSSCTQLVNLDLDENGKLSRIGDSAFRGCEKLLEISLPKSVTQVGEYAFNKTAYYENQDNWENGFLYIGKFLLKADQSKVSGVVIIKDGTVGIDINAFSGCSDIISITIPSSMKYICRYAFSGCNKLIEVINKSSLDIKLTSYGLNAKEVHSGQSKILEKDGYLFYATVNVNYLLGYTRKDTALTLPSDLNGESYEIYAYAFYNRSDITSVLLSSKVTAIGENAFSGCTGLISMTVPNSVTRIDINAFKDCYRLLEIVNKSSLNITVKSYGLNALEVHSVESSKVVKQGDYLFYTYDGKNYLVGYVGAQTSLVLPSDYNGEGYLIYRYAFYGNKSLVGVKIPDSVTEIGTYAFYDCTEMETIVIGKGVRFIGKCILLNTKVKCVNYRGSHSQWNYNVEVENDYLGLSIYYMNYDYKD